MTLLDSRPVTRDPDDGMRCTYECQACLHVYAGIFDGWHTDDHIPCTRCGHDEQDES
ncbi:hypothetical protein [Brevibacterium antiquum]|uniref:Uncharacterized protein n=1 Tax=Brevibacterium antiquum TaxID=234835 RepID=A0A2H1IMM4_9MICO|nr:hypothetical protein [Brevibacterium antiquum]SMX76475.1 hypothetical protein BANT10_01098 [Brevibacterium antiquum]